MEPTKSFMFLRRVSKFLNDDMNMSVCVCAHDTFFAVAATDVLYAMLYVQWRRKFVGSAAIFGMRTRDVSWL